MKRNLFYAELVLRWTWKKNKHPRHRLDIFHFNPPAETRGMIQSNFFQRVGKAARITVFNGKVRRNQVYFADVSDLQWE